MEEFLGLDELSWIDVAAHLAHARATARAPPGAPIERATSPYERVSP